MRLPQIAEYCNLPLVYSCSECSSAAQLHNSPAIRFDREQHAELSCIAGVGYGHWSKLIIEY
ncbi:MAG: putative zinc-binding protein [Gallionella sp.]